ncbi:hypothetical protein B0H10DRAFT_2054070, partial [Mycena sp. CBHHK59/15]
MRMLPLECRTGLLLACGEGVLAARADGRLHSNAAARGGRHSGRYPPTPLLCLLPPFFQLPPTAHMLHERGAACVSGRVDVVRSGASQVPDVCAEVHRYVPALLSPFPHFRPHHFVLNKCS